MGRRSKRLLLDRLIYGGPMKQIGVLLLLTVGVFFLVGGLCLLIMGKSADYFSDPVDDSRPYWQLYYYFADPGNQMSMNEAGTAARVIGLVMSTLGSIFLGGILISTCTNIIERRVEECRSGHNYYRFKDHVVVIGSDPMMYGIVRQVCRTDVRHVVVMTSQDVEQIRSALHASLPDKASRRKVIVNYGTRDSADHVLYAETVRNKAGEAVRKVRLQLPDKPTRVYLEIKNTSGAAASFALLCH